MTATKINLGLTSHHPTGHTNLIDRVSSTSQNITTCSEVSINFEPRRNWIASLGYIITRPPAAPGLNSLYRSREIEGRFRPLSRITKYFRGVTA